MISEGLLDVVEVESGYGKKIVLHGISFSVSRGTIVTLVGNNGAGKTTTLRTIFGLVRTRRGRIVYSGSDITNQQAFMNIRRGISFVPQGGRVFGSLSVRENLEIAAYVLKDKDKFSDTLKSVLGIFPTLGERKGQRAGTLSGGERQMLSVGCGLMLAPTLLLLDEPSIGLAPMLVGELMRNIETINGKLGVAICLVEQNTQQAFRISSEVYVMKLGEILMKGKPQELLNDERVKKAFLS